MKNLSRILLLTVFALVSLSTANASFCSTYGGGGVCVSASGFSSNSVAIAASAVFEVTGGNLGVTLINDAGSVAQQLGGAEVLTALLFNLNGAGTLTNVGSTASLTAALIGTATLTSASSDGPSQNWGLGSGVSAFGGSNLYSLSSTGLNSGIAGGKANLGGCTNSGASTDCRVLDGPSWGLTPHVNAGGHASGNDPLINYFAFFSLAGLTSGLTDAQLHSDLSNVIFQYGTSGGSGGDSTCLDCGQAVPEPTQIAFLLFSSALIGFIAWRRKRAEA